MFSFKQLLTYLHKAEWTTFQTHYVSEHLVATGIEAGTPGYVSKNFDQYITVIRNIEFVVTARSDIL
jgi:hypothetical protein